jgi:hypothetical protein
MQRDDGDHESERPQEPTQAQPETMWCLVGNAIDEHVIGEIGDTRRGTKQFTAGTKVYCLPAQWGDGYASCVAVGLARRTRDWITVVIRTALIANWRAQVVHHPKALERLRCGLVTDREVFNHQWESREQVELWAQQLRQSGGRIDRRGRIQTAAEVMGVAWQLIRQSQVHELWRCGQTLVILPRCREINELTAIGIYRSLEPDLGERWWR